MRSFLILPHVLVGVTSFASSLPKPGHDLLYANGRARIVSSRGNEPHMMLDNAPTITRDPHVSIKSVVTRQGGAAAAADVGQNTEWKQTFKVGSFFCLWYLFNIGYNIYNKKALTALPLPWTVGLIQLSLGLIYVFTLWLTGIRKAPKLSQQNVINLTPVAAMHAAAHISAVISLGAGAVSFTHIVKALEPAFTSLFSAVFLKQFFAAPVYLSLLPVMGGVALASLKERNFSWLAFNSAMLANTASAGRGIFAKKTMKEAQGKNMNAANLYAVLTILAMFIMAPFALILEGGKAQAAWKAALLTMPKNQLISYVVQSAAYYYLYNEVAFLALDSVHPVTHAVGNTIKRVVIIATSILVFKNPVTMQGYVGSAVAIGGVLLYSLAMEKTKKKKA